MSHNTGISAPNECYLCNRSNPSYLPACEHCSGITVPILGKNGALLAWTIFTFEPRSNGTPWPSLLHALETSNAQNGVVIRAKNGSKRHILVRHPETVAKIYSWARIQERSSGLVEAEVEIRVWRNMSRADKSGFYEFVGRRWDGGEVMVGE
jgi:hypothetical protein